MAALGAKVISAAIALSLLGACVPAPPAGGAQAPPPQIAKSREELALQAFEVGGMREQMLRAVRAAVIQSAGDPRLTTIIDEELKSASGPVADQAAKIYAEEFTAQELTDMVAFFSSPGGKAFLAKQAKLQDRLQPIGQRFGQDLLLRVVQRAQQQGLLPGGAVSPPTPTPAGAPPAKAGAAPEKAPPATKPPEKK